MQKNPYSPSGAGSLQIVDEPYAPFLDLLHSDVIHAIDQIGARRQVRAGTTLMLEGEAANRLMIVRSGLVKVTALHPDGYEAILALRGVGELFGEIAAFDRGIRSASASALIPSVIQFISIAEFEQLIARHPRVAMAIIETLAGRVRESDAHRVQFAADGVPRRLARALPQPADSHGNIHDDGKITIDLPFTQDDLAGTVSASRDAVTKALKTWRDQGSWSPLVARSRCSSPQRCHDSFGSEPRTVSRPTWFGGLCQDGISGGETYGRSQAVPTRSAGGRAV